MKTSLRKSLRRKSRKSKITAGGNTLSSLFVSKPVKKRGSAGIGPNSYRSRRPFVREEQPAVDLTKMIADYRQMQRQKALESRLGIVQRHEERRDEEAMQHQFLDSPKTRFLRRTDFYSEMP